MRRFTLLALGVLLASLAVASPRAATEAQTRWVIRDLGTSGGKASGAVAVNERGQVVGWWWAGTSTDRAFIWVGGKMRDLGNLGGAYASPDAINERGQVVGRSDTKRVTVSHAVRVTVSHAFFWEQGKMRDLGTLGGGWSQAYAINDRGQIAGTADTKSGAEHVFLWQHGKLRDITPHFRGIEAGVLGINERGVVLLSHGDTDQHGYVWEDGVLRDLGSLGGGRTYPAALNDSGQVVGTSTTKSGAGHAFLWENGKMLDLGVPRGQAQSAAAAINERGQIVGTAGASGASERSTFGGVWLWEHGKMRVLGLSDAHVIGISDAGQIVAGTGYFAPRDESVVPLKVYAWDGGRWSRLPHLHGGPSVAASAVNNHGQIVGRGGPNDDEAPTHAVLWTLKRG